MTKKELNIFALMDEKQGVITSEDLAEFDTGRAPEENAKFWQELEERTSKKKSRILYNLHP